MVVYAKTLKVTPAEYLELESSAETKSEYYDGVIVAMTGGTVEHDRVSVDVIISLSGQLIGKPCEVFSGNMRVNVPECNCYFYPDVSVVCSGAEFQRIDRVQSITNPILIVEVLSESTEKADRERKFFCYQTLPSLKTYILVAQDEPLVQVLEKQPNGKWEYSHYQGLDAMVPLPSIDCKLSLAAIYARVEFKEDSSVAMCILEQRARYGEGGVSGDVMSEPGRLVEARV